jgi:hypothetical protein
MGRCGIRPRTLLIEFDGRLVDYFSDPHPYRSDGEPAQRPAQAVRADC